MLRLRIKLFTRNRTLIAPPLRGSGRTASEPWGAFSNLVSSSKKKREQSPHALATAYSLAYAAPPQGGSNKTPLGRVREKGLSLLEAMIATVIVGIGFVGVYSLVVFSTRSMNESIIREKMQMQANQILDVIEADVANIDQYNMTLTNCTAPAGATTREVRQYEWCRRLSGELGAPMANDNRSVTITALADGSRAVEILLESGNEEMQVVMKRTFN